MKYRAVATLTDGVKQWDAIIYSEYGSMEAALEGSHLFASHGYDIVKLRIERVEEDGIGCGLCRHWEKRVYQEPCGPCRHYSNFERREG